MNKARKQSMNDTFEIKGIWYFPGQDMEEDGVQGILKYEPKRIVLELIGTLEEEKDETLFVMGQASSEQVIYGFSNNGEWITLYDCITTGAQMNAPGFDTISYAVNRFYAGSQLIENENDAIIQDCTFSLTYLDAWLDLNIKEIRADGNKIDLSIDLKKAFPQKKSIKIYSENISIDEEIGYNIISPKDYYSKEITKIVLNRFYRLSSIDKNLFSYNQCINNLHKIRRLLTMLVGSALYFLNIDINLSPTKEIDFEDKPFKRENKCRIFFTQVGDINKLQKISPYALGSILIFRKDIKDCIEPIFETWFSQQALLSEVVNPYISDLYLPAYQETRFLCTVRSIETFQRFFVEGKGPLSFNKRDKTFENEREALLSFIREHISKENQSSFIANINYKAEASLQNRLKQIFRLTSKILVERLFGQLNSKDKNKTIQMIVQTRNYYTHRDNKEKYPLAIKDYTTLNQYIKKLNIILQFLVLTHCEW